MSRLTIRKDSCELDFLALGALIHRLDPGVIPLVTSLAGRGRRVIIAGTDTDFRGEPFGPMPQLMAVAEVVGRDCPCHPPARG